MAKQPELLKEALGALRAVQRLNIEFDNDDHKPMDRAFKRVDRVLAKAAKAA
jgi:hypothetical protein